MKKILLFIILLNILIKPVIANELDPIIIGGKNGYTENRIAFKLLSIYLRNLNYNITEIPEINLVSAYDALRNKNIDLYFEYTGSILSLLSHSKSQPDPIQAYNQSKEKVVKDGLILLNMVNSNNTYKIIMKSSVAKDYNIKTFSDVSKLINEKKFNPKIGAGVECVKEMLDCLDGLQKLYNFNVSKDNIITLDNNRLYKALNNNFIDIAISGSAEGQKLVYNFDFLEDDKGFFSAYNLVPITRKDILKKYPALKEQINFLTSNLTQQDLIQMSYNIDINNLEITTVVYNWLLSKNLIKN